MQLEWEGKYGPATVVGIIGSLSVLVTIGVVWGSTTARLDSVVERQTSIVTAQQKIREDAHIRDERIAAQGERLGKMETSITFIVPALQRIETKLDAAAAK